MDSVSSRSKAWVFTCYDVGFRPELGVAKYLVYQGEVCPETGNRHVQGYVRFGLVLRWAQVCEYFAPFSRKKVWCQIAKGSEKQNREYCTKTEKDGKPMERWMDPVELGEYDERSGVRGRRTDWEEIKADIKSGASFKDIAENHLRLAVSCPSGVEKVINAIGPKPPLVRDVKVLVMWGVTNVGKSHRVWNCVEDWTQIYKVRPGRGPFDMYDRQKIVFFEEFDWHKWDIHDFKELLDKWPCQLDCRFSNKFAWWDRVVICSNESPDKWWPCELPADRDAVARRLTSVIHVESKDQEVMWEDK